jgi:tetratricopeptide (TPR) repeat protein
LLEEAVKTWPDDVAAWEAKGYALWLQGRKLEALADLEIVLAKAPEQETTLLFAAAVAAALGHGETAISYWRRALAIDPWPATPHFQLAQLLAKRQEWHGAAAECQAALQADPASLETRLLLVMCLVRNGNQARAGAEFDALLALSPPQDREVLRRWFAEQRP